MILEKHREELMDYVIYSSDEVEAAKHILLNAYFQKKVDSGEMNLIQALIKQKQIDKDLDKGIKDFENGNYVESEQLIEAVLKRSQFAQKTSWRRLFLLMRYR